MREAADAIAAAAENLAGAYRGRIFAVEDAARRWAKLLVPDRSRSDDKAQVGIVALNGLKLVTLNWEHVLKLGAAVLNPGRKPPKLYEP